MKRTKVHVGSKNQIKTQAVADAVALYPKLFLKPEITGVDVDVELFGHPKNIEETVAGAVERAKKAFGMCDYSFGVEGGLMEVPHTKKGFMEVNASAIYDGKHFYLGLSPAFEWPGEVTEMILSGKADASKAFKELGLTKHEKLGTVKGGIVRLLTNGRMKREDFIRYSIIMAVIQLEKPEFFE